MNEIFLTKKQYENLPYKSTKKTRGSTYGEIIGMLENHGIKGYHFGKTPDSIEFLEFPLEIERNGVKLGFKVSMIVPRLMYPVKIRKGRNAPTKMTHLESESWRVFWWYLKSKLEAIEFGISDEIKEFMYNITYALPDNGKEVKLGDVVMNNIERLDQFDALPDKRMVDVEFKEVDKNE